jgi:hypothetical protein
MRRWLERLGFLGAGAALLLALAPAANGPNAFWPWLLGRAVSVTAPKVAAAAPQDTPAAPDRAKPGAGVGLEVSDNASHVAGATLTFTNFAALKAFNATAIGTERVTATTTGYTTAGDGGASIYDWNASSTMKPDNIFFVKPDRVPTGRWVLRLPGGSLHPEQAGARCDGKTDDAAALNTLSSAINNVAETVDNGVPISLNPNRLCLISSASWHTPNGSTVSGTINPIDNAQGSFDPFRSGIVHPPSVIVVVSQGGKLKDMVILRQNLPMNPRTFQTVMEQVMTWNGENGAIQDVTPQGGGSGAGCSIGDKMRVMGGRGNPAWVQVADIGGGGSVTSFTVLDPGAYTTFPDSPALLGAAVGGPTDIYSCTTLPSIAFTPGTPRSVGVEMHGSTALENVFVAGFNVGIASISGGTRMDHVAYDNANGIDITNNGGGGTYRDLAGGELWSSSVQSRFGIQSILAIVVGGSRNQVGDVLTVEGGTCTLPPQITVDRVSEGKVAAAHISTYGDCSPAVPDHNPVELSNLHGGTVATADLLWATTDFRPGTAVYAHDKCDGCMFSDVGSHGWLIAFDVSNVAFFDVFNFVLEPAYFRFSPPPPRMSMVGLRTRNCVQATFFGLHAGGFSAGAQLGQTNGGHATLPGYACGSVKEDFDVNVGISLSGGSIGSSNPKSSYAIDIGPYSRGMISDIQINTAGLMAPVNVQANVYGWVIRDMMPYGGQEGRWLTIDPTSRNKVFANAIPVSGRTTKPLIMMGGLPTSSVGLPSGSLWNNRGVMNIVP